MWTDYKAGMEREMKEKIKKTKQVHNGYPIYRDGNGRMFVESGNARVYFSRRKANEIKERKRSKS